MRAMVFEGPGRPLALTEIAPPDTGRRSAPHPRQRLRGLPDGSPHRRRRAPPSQERAGARARDRRRRRRQRQSRRQVRDRRPGRRPLARLDLRRLRCSVARGARTSATGPASPAINWTAGSPNSRWPIHRFCFALPADLQRRRGRAAALCRPHRLSRVAGGRRRQADRPLRIWRGRSHHRAGGGVRGARDLRLHPSRRRGDGGVRCAGSARPGPAAPTPRLPSRSTRR